MIRHVVIIAALAAAGVAVPGGLARAQAAEHGGFVTRLGNDTIAVERFTRTADRLEGERVTRVPSTSVIRYAATLGKDGRVTRFEARLFAGDRLDGPPTWSSTIDFGSDAAVDVFTGRNGTDTIRVATGPGAVPMLRYSYALVEQLVRRARRMKGDKVALELVYPGQPNAMSTWVRRAGRDSVAIASFHDQAAYARVDGDGRILGYQALGTVIKVVATRLPDVDVPMLVRQFAATDAAGRAVGPLSPRDTVAASIGGATLAVDYGRPSKRGRTLFGGLVPWNQVWRTGADAATHFGTSRDLIVGDTELKAGTYTLWTVPTETGATLVVNGQTGQWGTDYDERRDVARIPLTVRRLDQPVERFTIAIVPAGDAAELHLSWDTTEWSVPVRVK